MAKSFKEIGRKAEQLIEKGDDADKEVQKCQNSVAMANMNVATARRQLATASMTDAEGNSAGNVELAAAQLRVAENMLAATQRALITAQENADSIRQQKNEHIRDIQNHNQIERGNLDKLRMLGLDVFGEESSSLSEGIAKRLNEAEDARVALLRSMGIEASPEYVSYEETSGASFSGIDITAINLGSFTDAGNGYSLHSGVTNIQGYSLTGGNTSFNTSNISFSMGNWSNEANSQESLSQDNQEQIENNKVRKMSDNERYVRGLRYIDNIIEVYRDNLRDLGVSDGEAMERNLAQIRMQYLNALSLDIQNGTFEFDNHDTPDFEQLANKIREDYKIYPPKYAITDKQRATIREGIRKGSVTEKDIRDIGRCVREQYSQLIDEKNQKYSQIRDEASRLALEYKNAKTQEERDRIETRRKLVAEKWNSWERDYNNSEIIKRVLSQYRDIGADNQTGEQTYIKDFLSFGTEGGVNAIENVRASIPSDWVQRSNSKPINVKHVSRGYFLSGSTSDTIALSGGEHHMVSCAFHEMGHRFENMYPEILKIEKEFYDRRTENEPLQHLGPGYGSCEMSRFDHFIDKYMGKDYAGTGYELLSMGMEGLYCGTVNMSRDTEYEDLILGILVSV